MRKAFADIPATDFDCPHDKPWAELPDPEQPYKDAKAAIEAAPNSLPWIPLKELLREVETAIYESSGNCKGNCAKNKARAKLVMAYKKTL